MTRNDDQARYERVAQVDSRIDTETGEFEMVMASEGEASDGHVLRVAGIQHDETIPLQLDHGRGAASNLGNVSNIRTGRREGAPVLLGVGRIRLTGEGDGLAQRRDLVDAIASGMIRGTSITWEADPRDVTERTALPKNHAAFVPPDEPNLRRRFGLFFAKSRAIEQSIVAIPADRSALIGRADACADASLRAMWQDCLVGIDARELAARDRLIEALGRALAAVEQRPKRAAGYPPSDQARINPPLSAVLAELAPRVADAARRTRLELDRALEKTLRELTGG